LAFTDRNGRSAMKVLGCPTPSGLRIQ
jgi:hypothetical protein